MSFHVPLPQQGTFAAWRHAARQAIAHQIAPEEIAWGLGEDLFATTPLPDAPGPHVAHVSKAFLKLAGSAIWHTDPQRFALLYEALWRVDHHLGEPITPADPLGRRLHLLAKAVGRDIHKMHAFVRFRELPSTGARRRFAAWFEPEHHSVEPASPFFVRRFNDMNWTIATPDLTARFTENGLAFAAGEPRPTLPEDASESLWATYFENIFNPARINLPAMRSEMPKKYWKNLPETRSLPGMIQDAKDRADRMRDAAISTPRPGAAAISTRYRAAMPRPKDTPDTLSDARESAMQCRRCGLCDAATQTVWGEGASDAAMMIVGEQPGDQEDLAGRPFAGPAGTLLRAAMTTSGIDAEAIWMTNAVKHFKFTVRGKRRIHQAPDRSEILACRWWLDLEQTLIRPRLILALGATAAFALTGNTHPLTRRRGKVEPALSGGAVMISWHPSYILRLPDAAKRDAAQRELMEDLAAAQAMALHGPAEQPGD